MPLSSVSHTHETSPVTLKLPASPVVSVGMALVVPLHIFTSSVPVLYSMRPLTLHEPAEPLSANSIQFVPLQNLKLFRPVSYSRVPSVTPAQDPAVVDDSMEA